MGNRVTIYDIANTAGVSPATVSRMIHQPDIVTERTREKILNAFAEHRIAPEDLATKRKPAAASRKASASKVVLVSMPFLDNPFNHDILNGMEDYLKMFHYHVVVSQETPHRNTMQSFLNYCATLQIDGVIILYPLSEDMLRQLSAAYPLVQCSEYNPFYQSIPYVSVDDYSISKLAMAHLIGKGCKRIGFFSTSYEFRYVQNRYRAYKAMLDSEGLELRSEYIVQVADFSYERILSAAEQFFRLPEPPDAIFAVSDKHAHAVVRAAQNMGLSVPEDVRVFGFDDTFYSTISSPTISTIEQPRRDLGVESAKLLLDLIERPMSQPKSIILPTKLIIRESA